MKNAIRIIVAAIVALTAVTAAKAQDKTRQERLTGHVYYFASDSLRGRKAGSEDAAKAAEYIRREYEAMGVKPFFSEWYMPFERKGRKYKNVVGVIEGADPALKNEYIVLGAHYDHLGVKEDGQVYNGADDNASGSAALIEIARMLMSDRANLRRSVIIAAFDAEEIGLYGSSALADTLSKAGTDVRLMMSIDMVGWLQAGKSLTLEGVATIRGGKAILEQNAKKVSIPITCKNFEKSILTATDTEGFAMHGVPTLAVSTGLKSPYHKPEDDAELIDYEGLDLVSDYIGTVAREFAEDESFGPSGRLSFKHRQKSATGFEFGPVIKYDLNRVSYAKSKLSSHGRSGFSAGLGAEADMGGFFLRAEGLYSLTTAFLSEDMSAFDRYVANAVKVPVMMGITTPRNKSMGTYLGIGGYWSRIFSDNSKTPYEVNGNPCGLAFTAGARVYNLHLSYDLDWQLNRFYSTPEAPKARMRTSSISLRWNF